jgi:putative peptidoglycan lipid II flippase
MLPRPRIKRGHNGVGRILRLMLPVIFGSSVSQINLLVDTLIASFLVTGSVSWLYYSDRLVEFPLGVFGIALATVILPRLAQHHALVETEDFSRTLDWGLRWVVAVGLPATVGLVTLAVPLLSTLFQYGEFSLHDVVKASYSLMAYSVGLLGFIMVKILANGFYSRQDTRTPVRFAVVALAANVVMNLLFVVPLAHAGLALSTALAATLNAGLLYRALRRSGAYHPQPGWTPLLLRVTLAGAVMGLVLTWSAGDAAIWNQWAASERVFRLMVWLIVGIAVYSATAMATGLRLRHLQVRETRQ